MATNTIPSGVNNLMKRIDTQILTAVKRVLQAGRDKIVMQTDFPVVTGRLRLSAMGNPILPGDSTYGVGVSSHSADGYFGSNVEYARRIEYGFFGKDSLGRTYNQEGQGVFNRGFMGGFNDYKKIIISTLQENANNNQAGSSSFTE